MLSRVYLILAMSMIICATTRAMDGPAFNKIPHADLKKEGPINQWDNGKGPHADVYQGTWKEEPVAIKYFHLKSLPSHLASEFLPYRRLDHPNLVTFFGICDDPGKLSMVSEDMPNSLKSYLQSRDSVPLRWGQIFKASLQIMEGLSYMHAQGVAHRHLKETNIFLSADDVVKIGDFGLNKIKLQASSAPGADTATEMAGSGNLYSRICEVQG